MAEIIHQLSRGVCSMSSPQKNVTMSIGTHSTVTWCAYKHYLATYKKQQQQNRSTDKHLYTARADVGLQRSSIWRHQYTRWFGWASGIYLEPAINMYVIDDSTSTRLRTAEQNFVLFVLRTQTFNSLIKTVRADRSALKCEPNSSGHDTSYWVYLLLCLSINFGTTSRFERVAGVIGVAYWAMYDYYDYYYDCDFGVTRPQCKQCGFVLYELTRLFVHVTIFRMLRIWWFNHFVDKGLRCSSHRGTTQSPRCVRPNESSESRFLLTK